MRIGWFTAKLYEDDINPMDIPECNSPASETKAIGKIMKRWEKEHRNCEGCFECKEAAMHKEDINYDNSIIVIKVDTIMSTKDLHKLHETILEQRKTGVIVLPNRCRASIAPKAVEIQVENGGEVSQ